MQLPSSASSETADGYECDLFPAGSRVDVGCFRSQVQGNEGGRSEIGLRSEIGRGGSEIGLRSEIGAGGSEIGLRSEIGLGVPISWSSEIGAPSPISGKPPKSDHQSEIRPDPFL